MIALPSPPPASAVAPQTGGALVAGLQHNRGVAPTGGADCWGKNWYGEATGQPGPYTQLAAGTYHSCGLTPSGTADRIAGCALTK